MSDPPTSERWSVAVGDEETTALFDPAADGSADFAYILAHSSGGHMEHRLQAELAARFAARGVSVVRFNFLYRTKPSHPPDRMPKLIDCFTAVVGAARERLGDRQLFVGGHSMGGRAASMMAADGFACEGLIMLGYPLHPAGQPEKLRDAHLPRIAAPVLCMNGTRDDLCRRDLMEQVLTRVPATFRMHWLEGADHSFHVQKRSGRTDEDVLDEIESTGAEWAREIVRRRHCQ
jgi:uncharacterized protein